MKKIVATFFTVVLMLSCQKKQSNTNWSIVYKNDEYGNTLLGSKKQLINAIRKGASLKVGWGRKGKNHEIEHLSEPIWIAILDEKEVLVHLDPQILSSIDWDSLTANYSNHNTLNDEWRVVIHTNGSFDAIWQNRLSGEVVEHRPQKHIMTWFVKDFEDSNEGNPLFNK